MEPKIIALGLIIIVAILLFITIRYKIKTDKKVKSFLANSPIPERKKSFWESSPMLAIYDLLGGIVLFIIIPEDWVKVETETSEALVVLIWGVINTICCFIIVMQNPKSIWYVPLIINAFMTFVAGSTETDSWNSLIVISLCGAWLSSIIASIIGVRMGRRKAIS